MKQPRCPDDAQLAGSLSGKLPREQAEEIANHVEACQSCADRLGDVESRGGTLAFPPVNVVSAPARLSDVMVRLRSMPGGISPLPASPGRVPPLADHGDDAETQVLALLDPAQADDELGRIGMYRVLRLVGRGGMGIVFEAVDSRTGRRVALKIIRPRLEGNRDIRQRFLHEARAMAAVRHANVVRVLQVEHSRERAYLAMEYLEGESLAQRLRNGPVLSRSEVLQVGYETAAGLAAAHAQRLIHRDVKPDNIFLVRRREPADGQRSVPEDRAAFHVRLLDFGLAMPVAERDTLDGRGSIHGTPAFMSPEQASGEPLDERSDLYGLGCVLYRMVTGRLPHDMGQLTQSSRARETLSPAPVRVAAPGTPVKLARLIDRLLAVLPDQRPASAREVADQLAMLQPRSVMPRRWLGPAGTAIGLFLLGAMAAGFWVASRGPHVPRARAGIAVDPRPGSAGIVDPEVAETEPNRFAATPDAAPTPLDPRWLERVRQLPPPDQVREVVEELRRRNPAYGGEHRSNTTPQFVTQLWIISNQIADLSPVQAFADLDLLYCPGTREAPGLLADLSPLAGMQLRYLDFGFAPVHDLSPLRGMPLNTVKASGSPIATLEPLAGMALFELQIGGSQVSDISPLEGMPLRILSLWGTPVRDLSPIAGCPTLEWLELQDTQVRDLAPLRGTPIRRLSCENAPIEDWSVLAELPLEELRLTYDPETHRDLLIGIRTLKSLNFAPPHLVLDTPPPETP